MLRRFRISAVGFKFAALGLFWLNDGKLRKAVLDNLQHDSLYGVLNL